MSSDTAERCQKITRTGLRCLRPARAVAVIQWSGERLPVCGVHLAKLEQALGSGVRADLLPFPGAAERP